jgi:hypothetical protein
LLDLLDVWSLAGMGNGLAEPAETVTGAAVDHGCTAAQQRTVD